MENVAEFSKSDVYTHRSSEHMDLSSTKTVLAANFK